MIKLLYVVTFMLFQPCYGSIIDRLKTKKDVQTFLKAHVDRRYADSWFFENNLRRGYNNKVHNNRFYKIDMDRDGRTDLLVNGQVVFAVLDKGGDIYQAFYFSGDLLSKNMAKLISFGIVNNRFQAVVTQAKTEFKIQDTVVYQFGTFIEPSHTALDTFSLEEIRFFVYGCRLDCPRYNMVIHKDGTARLYPLMYIKAEGVFSGHIPIEEIKKLSALLRYINPGSLKTDYPVPWYHSVGCGLQLRYNGRKKMINDAGSNGTFGLRAVYKFLKRWYYHTKWTKIE